MQLLERANAEVLHHSVQEGMRCGEKEQLVGIRVRQLLKEQALPVASRLSGRGLSCGSLLINAELLLMCELKAGVVRVLLWRWHGWVYGLVQQGLRLWSCVAERVHAAADPAQTQPSRFHSTLLQTRN